MPKASLGRVVNDSTLIPAQQVINDIIQSLISQYAPEQAILFGSYAYGHPTADSDIDLLVIKETQAQPMERRVQVRRLASAVRRGIPFSPLVLTPSELAQRLVMADPFYREIVSRGKLVYAKH